MISMAYQNRLEIPSVFPSRATVDPSFVPGFGPQSTGGILRQLFSLLGSQLSSSDHRAFLRLASQSAVAMRCFISRSRRCLCATNPCNLPASRCARRQPRTGHWKCGLKYSAWRSVLGSRSWQGFEIRPLIAINWGLQSLGRDHLNLVAPLIEMPVISSHPDPLNQLALPRHRSPGGQVVWVQTMPLCHFFHHRTRPKALRNDLRLDLVRPLPVNLTSRLSGRENLQCSLHGESPSLVHGKAITD